MIDIDENHQGPIFLREIEIRYKKKKVSKKSVSGDITCPADVVKLFHGLQDETKEKMITINLDAKNKILCFELIAIGSVQSIYVRPIEVFRTAFPVNAYGAVVLHNHPSGDPAPSQSDIEFTRTLNRMATDMGLKFLDHIIVGRDSYYSFKNSSDILTT